MRFYKQQHQFHCGIDLRAQNKYVCILLETILGGKTKKDRIGSFNTAALLCG